MRAQDDQIIRERAEAYLRLRREQTGWPHHNTLDNSLLPAGAPMIYQCLHCGWVSDILPEHWFLGRPRMACTECQVMAERGWISKTIHEQPIKLSS